MGSGSEISLDKAQDVAAAYRLQIAEGTDPVVERKLQTKVGMAYSTSHLTANKTVGALCDTYLALHAKKKRSAFYDERMIERFIRPEWGRLKATSLARAQVALLHAKLSRKTPYQANRVLALIKTMLNKASVWGFVTENHPNPAMKIALNKEESRERFVTREELPRIVAEMEKEPDVRIRGCLWLYLLTGARKNELLNARWEDVDLDRRELRIPRPKQGKPHTYPLSSRSMEVITHLPRFADNPYVFPGDKQGGHLVNISKAWNRVRRKAGLGDIRLHDLRRSVGSWLADAGHSLIAIGKVLGHSSPKTTQIYARLTDQTARMALEGHAERLLAVLQEASHANIPSAKDDMRTARESLPAAAKQVTELTALA